MPNQERWCSSLTYTTPSNIHITINHITDINSTPTINHFTFTSLTNSAPFPTSWQCHQKETKDESNEHQCCLFWFWGEAEERMYVSPLQRQRHSTQGIWHLLRKEQNLRRWRNLKLGRHSRQMSLSSALTLKGFLWQKQWDCRSQKTFQSLNI